MPAGSAAPRYGPFRPAPGVPGAAAARPEGSHGATAGPAGRSRIHLDRPIPGGTFAAWLRFLNGLRLYQQIEVRPAVPLPVPVRSPVLMSVPTVGRQRAARSISTIAA